MWPTPSWASFSACSVVADARTEIRSLKLASLNGKVVVDDTRT
jgi:hypothetical protein